MEHARPPAELCLEGGPASRAESWRKWFKQFSVFVKASGVHKEPADVKASLLINLIGPEGYDVYTTFKFSEGENKECFDMLVKKFNEHFETKQNTTMARFKFFSRNQESGEPIDDYVTALKLLAQHCAFEHLEEGLVRDKIVCGVQDGKLRDRLLRADDLTLARAVKICHANEMSTEEQRHIEGVKMERDNSQGTCSMAVDAMYARDGWRRAGPRSRGGGGGGGDGGAGRARASRPAQLWRASAPQAGTATASMHRRNDNMSLSAQRRQCFSCASFNCDGNKCPAKYATCFWCRERGHFKKKCPKLKRHVFQIDADVEDVASEQGDEMYYVSTISEALDSKDSNKWYETLILSLNGKKEVFKLDSGSDLNVMSLKNYKRMGLCVEHLTDDTTRAQSFCGNYIPIVGSTVIEWVYKNVTYKLRFVIANFECQSVLGKYACENMGLIKRVFSINIDKYNDLFEGLGKLPGTYRIITENNSQPSVCPVRKIPIGIRDKLACELDRMEKLGVIRKVSHPTPWVNAIVLAPKKDGSIRVCLDPRPLNRVVRRAHYPLPTLTDIATKLEGAQVFSKLDARSGFWMVELDDASADLCTFGTPFGRYQFLRLPYGINCASEVFHSKVRQLLEDLEGVESFVDDVIVWGTCKSQHDDRLKKLLDRAREVGIKFNKDKCEFQVNHVSYLGHTFCAKGMSVDKSKIRAIEEMPVPGDRSSLERFLGMINYLSKFIPNYSEIAAPLRCLLKKDIAWVWGSVHDNAVRILKACVCSAPVLALYSVREPVLLSVDASSRALGAVLLQGGRPVEFASATLTETQCRYAQIEKELLAIVYALERFHQYVYGRHDVTIESDHKPLEALFKKPLDSIPARLQRMMLRIQRYDFNVIYKPGKYLYLADTLSRAPLADTVAEKVSVEVEEQSCFLIENVRFSDVKMKMIMEATIKDAECNLIIRYIQNGWPVNKYEADALVRALWSYKDGFEYVNGIIFKDNLVYIPKSVRSEMLSRVHEGHMGIDRCKRRAREVMFWPGMSRDVELMVRRCAVCTERKHRPAREPLMSHAIPDLPWLKVGSDIFQHAGKYFLILVDYFSNYIEVCPLSNIGTKAVVAAMRDQFARHGIPQELVTDNGPAYVSKDFAEFKNRWGFQHITSSPNYPQSNGLSERSVQIAKNILIKSMASGDDFYIGLLNYRTTPRGDISSPAELLMGRRLNTRLPAYPGKLRPSRNNDSDYAKMLNKQQVDKKYYDRNSRALPVLHPGQPVIVADEPKRKHARVIGVAPQPRSYFVSDSSGRRYRRNRRHLIKLENTISDDIASPSHASFNNIPDDKEWHTPRCQSDDEGNIPADGGVVGAQQTLFSAGSVTPSRAYNHSPSAEIQRGRRPAAIKARQKLNVHFKKS